MTRDRALMAIVMTGTLFGLSSARTAERITAGDFQRLRELIRPHADEAKWTEIPWLSSLWEARKQAAAAGKPILLWEMDGNPLGCT